MDALEKGTDIILCRKIYLFRIHFAVVYGCMKGGIGSSCTTIYVIFSRSNEIYTISYGGTLTYCMKIKSVYMLGLGRS